MQDLNPPPPDGYTCKAVGGGTNCTGSFPEDVYEPAIECGSGAGAFLTYDDSHLDRQATLVRRGRRSQPARRPRSVDRCALDQPAQRQDRPVHQNDKITDDLLVPGDLGVSTRDDRG